MSQIHRKPAISNCKVVLIASGIALSLLSGSAWSQGRAVRITATVAEIGVIEETEWAIGVIESLAAPRVAAEVDGKVLEIRADEGRAVAAGDILAIIDSAEYRNQKAASDADVGRLSALIRDKELDVERIGKLIGQNLVSQDEADQVAAELDALMQERAAARARAAESTRKVAQAMIRAPVDSEVSIRHIDTGDYVQPGTIAFDLIDVRNLRVRLPFPEYRAPHLRRGMAVRLTSAASGSDSVDAMVTEIRPDVNPANRAISVIVDFGNPGDWRPGASARAELVLERRTGAVTVPQSAIVRRPAGDVVYVIEDGRAIEYLVERGARNGDRVEIRGGLSGGEKIAVDGAGFLTNGASVEISES